MRIDFAGVESCIKQMEGEIATLEATAARIDAVVMNQLGEYWEGNSYNTCINTYQENYQNMLMTQVPELVRQLKDFMETCRNCLEQVDNELAGM